MEVSDQILLARIAAGDRAAFADFYDRHSGRVYGLILKLTRNSPEADDVLQDTFHHIWTRADQFDAARGTPLAWLILIARSRALDHLRRGKRRNSSIETSFDDPMIDDGFTCHIQRSETAERTRRALAQLPPEQDAAIRMSFYGGFSHQEIAESLDTALGTIKTRVRLGMRKLRELLRDLDSEFAGA